MKRKLTTRVLLFAAVIPWTLAAVISSGMTVKEAGYVDTNADAVVLKVAQGLRFPSSPPSSYPATVAPPPPITPPANPSPPPPQTAIPQKSAQEPGITNPRTGEFYPGAMGGVTNPRTGVFMPKVEGGYLNPETGEVIPKK